MGTTTFVLSAKTQGLVDRAYKGTANSGLRGTHESLGRLRTILSEWKGSPEVREGYKQELIANGIGTVFEAYETDTCTITRKMENAAVDMARARAEEGGMIMGNGRMYLRKSGAVKTMFVEVNGNNMANVWVHTMTKSQRIAGTKLYGGIAAISSFFTFSSLTQNGEITWGAVLCSAIAGFIGTAALRLAKAVKEIKRFTPQEFERRMAKIGNLVEEAIEAIVGPIQEIIVMVAVGGRAEPAQGKTERGD
jgi:hypothetical protein